MGFQHMSKAARRRIQSKGGKARAKRGRRIKETVTVVPWGPAATTTRDFSSVHRITVEGNGPARRGRRADELGFIDEFVKKIRADERERIKAAILKVIG